MNTDFEMDIDRFWRAVLADYWRIGKYTDMPIIWEGEWARLKAGMGLARWAFMGAA